MKKLSTIKKKELEEQYTEELREEEDIFYEAILAALAFRAGVATPTAEMEREARSIASRWLRYTVSSAIAASAAAIAVGADPREYVGLSAPQVRAMVRQRMLLDTLNISIDVRERIIDSTTAIHRGERLQQFARDMAVELSESASKEAARVDGMQRKRNIDAGDDLVCPVCIANSDAGWIGLDDTFPDGSDGPPYHSHCRCELEFSE